MKVRWGRGFITAPKGVTEEEAEEGEAEDGMCVYSIIAAVSHCGADTARKHVSRRVFLRVGSLQSPTVYLFFFPPASSALAPNTCVSERRLIKFDEFKKGEKKEEIIIIMTKMIINNNNNAEKHYLAQCRRPAGICRQPGRKINRSLLFLVANCAVSHLFR